MSFENPASGDPRRQYQDFVDRYQRRPQGISEEEAAARYQEVAPHLSPDDHLRAAQEAFARMSPEERARFGRYMAEQAQRQGHDFIDLNQDGIDDRLQDPDYLARTTTQVHQQQPGLLSQLFGGSEGHAGGGHAGGGHAGGGMLSSPLAKGVLGGIAAYGISRLLGGGHHGGHHRRRHGHGHGGFEIDDLFEGGGFFGGEED
jgi:hypothetical protein